MHRPTAGCVCGAFKGRSLMQNIVIIQARGRTRPRVQVKLSNYRQRDRPKTSLFSQEAEDEWPQ